MSVGRALWFVPLAAVAACGPPPPSNTPKPAAATAAHVIESPERPRVAAVVRGGDPAVAVAAYAITEGAGGASDDAAAVALAGLLEVRLAGLHPRVTVSPGVVSVAVLVDDPGAAGGAAAKIAAALLARAGDPSADAERTTVERKLSALAALPAVPTERRALALCEGVLRPAGRPLAVADVEVLRAASVTRARVAFAATGPLAAATRVAEALRSGPAWSAGDAPTAPPLASAPIVDDATGRVAQGRARLTVAAWGDGARARGRALAVGADDAPLRAQLSVLDGGVTFGGATVERLGPRACTAVALDVAPAAVGAGVALARRELAEVEREAESEAADPGASDARDAAELAAASALSVSVGDPSGNTSAVGAHVSLGGDPRAKAPLDVDAATKDVARDLAAADATLARPALPLATELEPGQPELVVLVASPCGTSSESEDDAGLGALAVTAAAGAAGDAGDDVALEPFVAADGLGVVARGRRRAGELGADLARRVAKTLAKRLLVDPLADGALAAARLRLGGADAAGAPAFAHLARTLAPKHPALVAPTGIPDALLHASDAQARTRLDGLRHGPLRAAALVPGDAADARALAAALDRWVPRSFGGAAPACADPGTPPPPKPGTYVKEGASPEAWLAWPLAATPADLSAADAFARWLDAAALPRALAGLARNASARVVGAPRAPFLVVHVATADAALDGAVAQIRALVDRLQHGLAETDARAALALAATGARDDALDPRRRVVASFRGARPAPTLDGVRAIATALHDDALVIAAVRPRREKAAKP